MVPHRSSILTHIHFCCHFSCLLDSPFFKAKPSSDRENRLGAELFHGFQEWRPQNTRRAMSKTRRGHEPSLLWHLIWVWFKIGIQENDRTWDVYYWKCPGSCSPKNTLSHIRVQTAGTKRLKFWSFVELIWPPSVSNVWLRCSITFDTFDMAHWMAC